MRHTKDTKTERLAKIAEDEPCIVFRAQDRYFLNVVEAYMEILHDDGQVKSSFILDLEELYRQAEQWQSKNHYKTPDL